MHAHSGPSLVKKNETPHIQHTYDKTHSRHNAWILVGLLEFEVIMRVFKSHDQDPMQIQPDWNIMSSLVKSHWPHWTAVWRSVNVNPNLRLRLKIFSLYNYWNYWNYWKNLVCTTFIQLYVTNLMPCLLMGDKVSVSSYIIMQTVKRWQLWLNG